MILRGMVRGFVRVCIINVAFGMRHDYLTRIGRYQSYKVSLLDESSSHSPRGRVARSFWRCRGESLISYGNVETRAGVTHGVL